MQLIRGHPNGSKSHIRAIQILLHFNHNITEFLLLQVFQQYTPVLVKKKIILDNNNS